MDGITLSDLLQVLQALSIAFGIIVFYVEYRKSRRDKGYETYVQTILSLVDIEKLFIQHPEMQSLWTYDQSYKDLSKERRKIYHWCNMLIDVFEIVFIASPLNRRWMSEDEWDGWDQYISELMEHSEDFRLAWKRNRDFYCEKFRNHMDEKMPTSA